MPAMILLAIEERKVRTPGLLRGTSDMDLENRCGSIFGSVWSVRIDCLVD